MFDLHLRELKQNNEVKNALADILKIPLSSIQQLGSDIPAEVYFDAHQKTKGFRTSIAIYPRSKSLEQTDRKLASEFAKYFKCDVVIIPPTDIGPYKWLLIEPSGHSKIVDEEISEDDSSDILIIKTE